MKCRHVEYLLFFNAKTEIYFFFFFKRSTHLFKRLCAVPLSKDLQKLGVRCKIPYKEREKEEIKR